MKCFTADFKTTNDAADCRVYAYGISSIGNCEDFKCGESLDEFMEFCADSTENYRIYFNNLKIAGVFIINWLNAHGFEVVRNKQTAKENFYTCLISSENQYYKIEVYFMRDKERHQANRVVFYDSLKILNAKTDDVAKDFNIKKDYPKKSKKYSKDETFKILQNDTEIYAEALNEMFKAGVDKSTIGLSALEYYKTMTKGFGYLFPRMPRENDEDIRLAYRGGFTYLNPKYKGKEISAGIDLDCNSEYPAMMANNLFPFGLPVIFEGEPKKDLRYPLFIVMFACSFKLKKNKIPTIQIKNSRFFDPMEYLESSDGRIVSLTMTSVDYELFIENYDVEDLKFLGGYKFKARDDLFSDYIMEWNKKKINAKLEKNNTIYQISKKMMNALYGKFGSRAKSILKEPVYDESDGLIHFYNYKGDERRSCYVPVAAFTTAYGRSYLIRTAQKIRDWSLEKYGEDFYIYSDTDSIKLKIKSDDDIEDLKKIVDIHKYKLGAWKIESKFNRAKFLKPKCYIEEETGGNLNVVIAGFPEELGPLLNFDNFKKGFSTDGMTISQLVEMARKNGASDDQIMRINNNMKYKYVKGGVILEEAGFTIK